MIKFLYGTAWKEDETQRCVREALTAGFRGIDTANQRKHYHEAAVGFALRDSYEKGLISRADLFLQTKFTHIAGQDTRLPYEPSADPRTQVMQSFESSLQHLNTDYLDSYVLHGPSMRVGITEEDWKVWNTMEELYKEGRIRFLGISNVSIKQLQTLCDSCEVRPSFVQNRCYASQGWNRDVREFCVLNKIQYQGFSLLTANKEVLDNSHFKELVVRYKCTPAQLIFSFALNIGMLPLTGTTNPRHMREDLDAINIAIQSSDVNYIESILG